MVKLENLIAEITQWVDNNLDKPLTISDVAAQSGYSKWHLQRIFFKVNNIRLAAYIRNNKMDLAAQDLITSQDKIMDISLRYGFDSQQAFTRCFAKKHRIPPHKYRVLNAQRHL